MVMGLNWDTWIGLAAAVIAGLMAISAERSRRGASRFADEALTHAKKSDAREVYWPIFQQVRAILLDLNSASDKARLHALWVRAHNLHEKFKPVASSDVLRFLKRLADALAEYVTTIESLAEQGHANRDRLVGVKQKQWSALMAMHDESESIFRTLISPD